MDVTAAVKVSHPAKFLPNYPVLKPRCNGLNEFFHAHEFAEIQVRTEGKISEGLATSTSSLALLADDREEFCCQRENDEIPVIQGQVRLRVLSQPDQVRE